VWETLAALLLYCTGANFDTLTDYYHCEQFSTGNHLTRLGQLAPLLKEATHDDWRLLERIVEHLPSSAEVDHFRVQVLSLAATTGAMPDEEVQSALQFIFQGRDDERHFSDTAHLAELAFKLPRLPVAVLRQTIRGALAAGELYLEDQPDDGDD
jgi:hypothetical protein